MEICMVGQVGYNKASRIKRSKTDLFKTQLDISLPYGLMKVCASCVLFSELVPVWAPPAECNGRSTNRPDPVDGVWT